MMSFSSSIVCVIGCKWPSRNRRPGSVGSNAACGGSLGAGGEPLLSRGERRFDGGLHFVEPLAGRRLVGLIDLAEPFLQRL